MNTLKKIAVLASGSGSNLQSIIDQCNNKAIPAEIAVVISNKKSAYALERAAAHKIPNYFVSRRAHASNEAFNRSIVGHMEAHKIDLVVLAGYLSILTPEFIAAYRHKIINIHPALIPSFCGEGYYGLHVHRAVLDYGVKVSGATVHFVDEGTDTGPVILQESVVVKDEDTPESLQQRVLKVEHYLLPLAVKLFCEDKIKLQQTASGRLRTIIKAG